MNVTDNLPVVIFQEAAIDQQIHHALGLIGEVGCVKRAEEEVDSRYYLGARVVGWELVGYLVRGQLVPCRVLSARE